VNRWQKYLLTAFLRYLLAAMRLVQPLVSRSLSFFVPLSASGRPIDIYESYAQSSELSCNKCIQFASGIKVPTQLRNRTIFDFPLAAAAKKEIASA